MSTVQHRCAKNHRNVSQWIVERQGTSVALSAATRTTHCPYYLLGPSPASLPYGTRLGPTSGHTHSDSVEGSLYYHEGPTVLELTLPRFRRRAYQFLDGTL